MEKLKIWAALILEVLAFFFFISKAASEEVELGQVVVTATRTEMEISEAPQSITVITREEIMNTPDQTVAQVIQRAAGVEVVQNGPLGSISAAQIRGSETEQVLILLNGRRINDAQNGKFDLSNLPLEKGGIERIEVLRGVASALYGADAMGGVINIITKTPSPEPYTRLSTSYGRFQTQEYSLIHRWKPGALGYGLPVSRGKSQGFRPNSDYNAWILGGEFNIEAGGRKKGKDPARRWRRSAALPRRSILIFL